MQLLKFRVQQFRSVMDSGWVETDDVTTLVGINEAGKSNLLLALWKLNPAKGGKIDLLADLPRKLFTELRNAKVMPKFIETEFLLSDDLISELVKLTGADEDDVQIASVSRDYLGNYYIGFPYAKGRTIVEANSLTSKIEQALTEIESRKESGKSELGLKDEVKTVLNNTRKILHDKEFLNNQDITEIRESLVIHKKPLKTSQIGPILSDVVSHVDELINILERPSPTEISEATKLVLDNLPMFVYYSNYGNLDSEIYLPHVIENLKRVDLTGTTEAKARTLRVLFEYVGLDPQEILDLGMDPEPIRDSYGNITRQPTLEEIEKAAANKTKRDVLLQSASASLTSRFKEWWKQGNYIFDFHADGNHFRIGVSDDLRPEKIELEGRSTGLQWFLSFYLVFLVESKESHKGAILLLDEAGLSLHPLAQRDLSKFFENLSKTNQIINTTHSPFLVDTNHVDRIKVVYVDNDGYTVASSNLRAAEDRAQARSVYAVHAALGLSISDTLLQGCQPVITEGPSDQFYMSAIKNYLISEQLIAPKEEIVFVPSGGVRGIEGIASILAGKVDGLPYIILDSDKPGQDFKNKLLQRLYKDNPERIIEVKEILQMESSEVEDLIPFDMMRPALNRLFRDVEDEYFEDIIDPGKPILLQIENFARKHGIMLETGWKVDIARQAKQRLTQLRRKVITQEYVDLWQELFKKLLE